MEELILVTALIIFCIKNNRSKWACNFWIWNIALHVSLVMGKAGRDITKKK